MDLNFDVNAKTAQDGNTPLHLALERKPEPNTELIKYLLENDADLDEPNDAGDTPRSLIEASDNETLQQLAEEYPPAAGRGFNR